jgi:hypothetical protein
MGTRWAPAGNGRPTPVPNTPAPAALHLLSTSVLIGG